MHENLVAEVVEFLYVVFDSVNLPVVELVLAPVGFNCLIKILPVYQILLGLESF
jgi:hypothetical protein